MEINHYQNKETGIVKNQTMHDECNRNDTRR